MKISDFTTFINEKYITWVEKEIKIVIDIETSNHAIQRYSRHGSSNLISDDDIVDVVERSIEHLTYALINGKLKVKDAFVIKDIESELNIVCNLYLSPDDGCLKLVVITVMKSNEFKTLPGQYILEI
jgi:hypothetical protein